MSLGIESVFYSISFLLYHKLYEDGYLGTIGLCEQKTALADRRPRIALWHKINFKINMIIVSDLDILRESFICADSTHST